MDSKPITTTEAADRLNVTMRRVQALIRQGKLRATKFGRDWQIDPLSVDELILEPREAGRPRKGK